MAFNRGRNSRPGGFRSRPSFGDSPRFGGRTEKPRFGDRGDRGPVEMHQAICDNCGKSCEVPFRPTSGKPVFCSNCFEKNKGSDTGRYEDRGNSRSGNSEERQMFDAVCDNCGNTCKVPFRPSGDKPIYCSNCFGEKKGAINKEGGQPQSQFKEQFESLNTKLDKILQILNLNSNAEAINKEVVLDEAPKEKVVFTKAKTRPTKKVPKKSK